MLTQCLHTVNYKLHIMPRSRKLNALRFFFLKFYDRAGAVVISLCTILHAASLFV